MRAFVKRAYGTSLAVARRMESLLGLTGFDEAELTGWRGELRRRSRLLRPRDRDEVFLANIHKAIVKAEPDYKGGYRLDRIAERISKVDKGSPVGVSAVDVGKALARAGMGLVRRRGYYDNASRSIRATVWFSDEEKKRLMEFSNGFDR